jgi:hypothetical protein
MKDAVIDMKRREFLGTSALSLSLATIGVFSMTTSTTSVAANYCYSYLQHSHAPSSPSKLEVVWNQTPPPVSGRARSAS